MTPPAADAAILLGPTLAHPDPSSVRPLWEVLGGDVSDVEDGLHVTWEGSALDVVIVPGERAAPLGVRLTGVGLVTS